MARPIPTTVQNFVNLGTLYSAMQIPLYCKVKNKVNLGDLYANSKRYFPMPREESPGGWAYLQDGTVYVWLRRFYSDEQIQNRLNRMQLVLNSGEHPFRSRLREGSGRLMIVDSTRYVGTNLLSVDVRVFRPGETIRSHSFHRMLIHKQTGAFKLATNNQSTKQRAIDQCYSDILPALRIFRGTLINGRLRPHLRLPDAPSFSLDIGHGARPSEYRFHCSAPGTDTRRDSAAVTREERTTLTTSRSADNGSVLQKNRTRKEKHRDRFSQKHSQSSKELERMGKDTDVLTNANIDSTDNATRGLQRKDERDPRRETKTLEMRAHGIKKADNFARAQQLVQLELQVSIRENDLMRRELEMERATLELKRKELAVNQKRLAKKEKALNQIRTHVGRRRVASAQQIQRAKPQKNKAKLPDWKQDVDEDVPPELLFRDALPNLTHNRRTLTGLRHELHARFSSNNRPEIVGEGPSAESLPTLHEDFDTVREANAIYAADGQKQRFNEQAGCHIQGAEQSDASMDFIDYDFLSAAAPESLASIRAEIRLPGRKNSERQNSGDRFSG